MEYILKNIFGRSSSRSSMWQLWPSAFYGELVSSSNFLVTTKYWATDFARHSKRASYEKLAFSHDTHDSERYQGIYDRKKRSSL